MKTIHRHRNMCSLLVLAGLFSILAGCSREPANASLTAPPPPAVTVSKPLQKTVTHYAEFSGTTEARESVTVRARVEGVLEKIHFSPGAVVKAGDLLYSIDARPYETRLEEAKADLAIRKAELQLAEATGYRLQRAFKDKAVSEVAVIEAEANLSTARAAVDAARAAVTRATLDLSYTRVKAPISGRIARSMVDTGNLVGAGERTVLTTIVQDDPIYAYFTVSERDLLYYQQQLDSQPSPTSGDTPVFLGLANQSGYPFEGHIDYIHNRVNAETGTIRIRAIFPNPDHRLLPGLFARVRVPIGNATNELLVPNTALGRDQQGHYLLIADAENTVRHQPVTTGALIDGMRVISKGIAPDDRIIVNGLQKARPGAPVTPVDKNLSAVMPEDAAAPSA